MEEEIIRVDEEGTESEEDLGLQDPSIYSRAVIWGTDWTAETIVNQLRKKNIDLNPDFQRREAWDTYKKSKFIESIILGLPVPPIILAERKDKKNSYLVIDGKQRLLSVMQFCAEKDEENLFGLLFLDGLEILEDLNLHNYHNLDKISSINDYKTQFDNQSIRTIVIRNWPNEEFLYTVFLRLNTGSLKLSPQELRQALHPGEFLRYVNTYTQENTIMQNVLKIKKPDPRMRDVELIIRYFAFKNFLPDYKGNLKEFLDDACSLLNKNWETNKDKYLAQLKELEYAINFTTSIFDEKSRFSKFINNDYSNIFNRTIFDIMIYYFSDPVMREKCKDKTIEIKEAFEKLMTSDTTFISSVSSSTKDLEKTKKRYQIWGSTLKDLIS